MVFQSIHSPSGPTRGDGRHLDLQQQMQSCPQLIASSESRSGQQIRTAFVGVTAMAEALQLFEL